MTTRSAGGLHQRLGKLSRRLEDISEIARSITCKRSLEQILAALMEVVTRTVSAEVGGIFGEDEEGVWSHVSWGLDTALVSQMRYGGEDPLLATVYERRSVVRGDLAQEVHRGERKLRVHNLLAVPLVTGREILGVLVLVNSRCGGSFDSEDEEAVALLMELAAVAIDNARLLEVAVEREKLAQQMTVAETIQRTLLPDGAVTPPWLAWQAHYQPAYGIGGDYFDVIPLDTEGAALVLGDVSNHGIPAALLMTAVRTAVRAECRVNPDPSVITAGVNLALCQDFDRQDGMFVSLFVAVIHHGRGEIHYCNAGHPPPYLWDAARMVPVPLASGGPILGPFEGAEYSGVTLSLGPGWWLFAYTDGLTESTNARGELFGTARVRQLLSAQCGIRDEGLIHFMQQAVVAHGGGPEERDDLTMLWVGERIYSSRHRDMEA